MNVTFQAFCKCLMPTSVECLQLDLFPPPHLSFCHTVWIFSLFTEQCTKHYIVLYFILNPCIKFILLSLSFPLFYFIFFYHRQNFVADDIFLFFLLLFHVLVTRSQEDCTCPVNLKLIREKTIIKKNCHGESVDVGKWC